MTVQQPRVPAGVRTGGRFEPTTRTEPDIHLTGTRGRSTRHFDPAAVTPRRMAVGHAGEHVVCAPNQILDAGTPVTLPKAPAYARAATDAVTRRLLRAGVGDATLEKVQELAARSARATVLTSDERGVVRAKEGILVRTPSGNIAILHKGGRSHRGVLLHAAAEKRWHHDVLDVAPGYGATDRMTRTWADAAATLPPVREFDLDDVPADPDHAPRQVAAAYLFTAPTGDPTHDGRGSMLLATDVQTLDGQPHTVRGYFLHPGDSGLACGLRTVPVAELAESAGRVDGFPPGAMDLDQALDLGRACHRDNNVEAAWEHVAHVARSPHIYRA